MKPHILIGIAGGSGSGKTLVAKRIFDELGSDKVVIIQQDSYYRDLGHLSLEERKKQNFDHPDSFDHEFLIRQLKDLLAGKSVDQPVYDYAIHSRRSETKLIGEHIVIVLEGILILHKVYVDTDDDVRLIRRIRRDVNERNRSLDSILDQYENSVRPMQLQFIEPTKRYADIIIPEGGYNLVAIDLLKTIGRAGLLNVTHRAWRATGSA
ncbi:MAG: uridine kinase [bacterium]|nr:uridine kinase [bacterium]